MTSAAELTAITAAKIDAGSATNRGQKQTTTSLSSMVSRRPLMFEEAIEPVVQGMTEEQRFLLDMQGCKCAHALQLAPRAATASRRRYVQSQRHASDLAHALPGM